MTMKEKSASEPKLLETITARLHVGQLLGTSRLVARVDAVEVWAISCGCGVSFNLTEKRLAWLLSRERAVVCKTCSVKPEVLREKERGAWLRSLERTGRPIRHVFERVRAEHRLDAEVEDEDWDGFTPREEVRLPGDKEKSAPSPVRQVYSREPKLLPELEPLFHRGENQK